MPVPTTPTLQSVNFTDGVLGLIFAPFPDPTWTGVKIYRGTSTGTETLLDTGTYNLSGGVVVSTTYTTAGTIGPPTEYTDSSVSNGTQYFYTVKLTNASGDSAASNELSATPSAVTCLATRLSTSIPPVMIVGNAYPVSFTWTNTGTKVWSKALGVGVYFLNPTDNSNWGISVYPNMAGTASIGQTATFSGILIAPSTVGVTNLQMGLQVNACGVRFGDSSTNVAVQTVVIPQWKVKRLPHLGITRY